MNRIALASIPVAACLCLTPLAGHAQDRSVAAVTASVSAAECARAASMTNVQRQVVAKAAQGIRPLVQFIYRTRMIYQLDAMETVAWLDQRREMQAACTSATSLASPAPDAA